MRSETIRLVMRWSSTACVLAAGISSTSCASSPREAEDVAAAGRRVQTVSIGNSQGGALSQVEIETGASVRDSVIAVSPQAAWSELGGVFETLELETPTVDRRSFSMGNERFVARRIEGRSLSNYLDCGTSFGRARADQYRITMQILVRLLRDPSGGTRVRTMLDAYAQPQDVAGNSYHCTSKGTLERRIAELLAQSASV
jgi:hypothetical protein